MLPIVTPMEMRAIDREADVPVAELIQRAGWALANEALDMLGGAYGRRVVVYAGKGNNGADGRTAAVFLERRGVRCEVVSPSETPRWLSAADLVIDACVGTGLDRQFDAPDCGTSPVLAVDIPSGIDGSTGRILGSAVRADRTLTFGALKPGLLLGDGPDHTGRVVVADIGLDCARAQARLVQHRDVVERWPRRVRAANKWDRAVLVIGGSPGMAGALRLCGEAAARAGAGYVSVATPGATAEGHIESVSLPLPDTDWGHTVQSVAHRFGALVVGPGLESSRETTEALGRLVALDRPLVLDAGTIDAAADLAVELRRRPSPAILTPHDGEFRRLTGEVPGVDRAAAARSAASRFGAVVLLKGSPTIVAAPDGQVLISNRGDQRLATAGTGDVLAGMIGAGLAGGLDPLHAAALAAEAHASAAGATAPSIGMVASDLLGNIAEAVGGATLA